MISDRVATFHAHVYFDERDPTQLEAARRFADRVAAEVTEVAVTHFVPRPVGPHPRGMFEVTFARAAHTRFVTWLAFERPAGWSVLVHPLTGGSELLDHTDRALWLGTPLPLDPAPLLEADARVSRGR